MCALVPIIHNSDMYTQVLTINNSDIRLQGPIIQNLYICLQVPIIRVARELGAAGRVFVCSANDSFTLDSTCFVFFKYIFITLDFIIYQKDYTTSDLLHWIRFDFLDFIIYQKDYTTLDLLHLIRFDFFKEAYHYFNYHGKQYFSIFV